MTLIDKQTEIIQTCEKVMNGLDDETLKASSAVSLCRKIARLINDENSVKWLDFECQGYPHLENGFIEGNAFIIATNHGRGYVKDAKRYIFTELAFELEHRLSISSEGIKAFSTAGASVSGDNAAGALHVFETNVHNSVIKFANDSAVFARRLSILKNEYYKFASSVYINCKFSKLTSKIFEDYSGEINNFLYENIPNSKFKLQAIEQDILENNPEKFSQIASSCRRLLQEFSEKIFDLVFPDFNDKEYICKSGKSLKIDNEKYKNKLFAVIDKINGSDMNIELNNDDALSTINYIDRLNDFDCKGVHSDISKLEFKNCVIRTYVLIGSLITIYKDYLNK